MALKGRIRAGMPIAVVAFLGLSWSWMTCAEYRGQVLQPGDTNEEVVLRFYDRDLRLAEAARRSSGFARWLSGSGDEREWLVESRETIRKLHLEDLGDAGEQLDRAISLRLGEGIEPVEGTGDPGYRSEMREWLLAGYGQAWDFEIYLEEGSDAELLAIYRGGNDRLFARALWAAYFGIALLIAGVGGALYLMAKHRGRIHPGSRIPDSWALSTVLGVFFLAELLVNPWAWIISSGYGIIIPEIYALYDLLWRAFPAVFSAWVFLGNPKRMRRVFGLGKRIDWLLLIAALAFANIAHLVFFLILPVSHTDPTDFLLTSSDDLGFFLMMLLSSAIIAPVCEEITYRGFLFQGLKSKVGAMGAAAISTVIFALVHTQYDFPGWLSVGTMGLTACYITHRTGSLKTAMAFHATGNLLIALNVYVFYQLPL